MELKTIDDLREYLRTWDRHSYHTEDYVFGMELEGVLTDTEGKPLETSELIPELNSMYRNFEFGEEAGAAQLEIRTHPRQYCTDALREMEEYLLDVIENIVELAEKIHGKEAIFLLLGSNPHPAAFSDRWISKTARAKKMASWRSQFPPIKVGSKKIKAEHVALCIQSVHLHIQGKSPDDVADKFNRLLYTIPEYIAISANSPIMAGEILDYKESRLLLYEQADGGNAGFPRLKRYPISSLMDYGDYLTSFPYVMGATLRDMVKERHEDARIRFEIPFRVENRVYPMQCTMKENMALIEYTIGRLKYAQTWSRQEFPSLKEIEINRIEAIKKSLSGEFIWGGRSVDVKDYLMKGIEKAEKGIKTLGCNPRYLNIIRRRVKKRRTSGDVIRRWYRKSGGSVDEKVASLVNKIWEHTRKNTPIV
ncbi:MAG: hypothetical protein FE043_03070 [Thermoplasmata archaeon]|nr:MAG: hypothetical protein FE043_03070 [Thermoplasmata archaeon]